MRSGNVARWLFLVVAILSMAAALTPMLKGGPMNVTFLGVGVVFFALAAVAARKAREREPKAPV